MLEKADAKSWQYNIRCLVSEIDTNWDPFMETKKIMFGFQPFLRISFEKRLDVIKNIIESKGVIIVEKEAKDPILAVDPDFLVMTQAQGKNKGSASIHFEITTDQLSFLLMSFPNFQGFFDDYRSLLIWSYCMRNVIVNQTKGAKELIVDTFRSVKDLDFTDEMFEWFSYYC